MTTNRKEEAMGYRRIGLRQIFLLTGLIVLLWALAGAIGCGSNESPPSSRQDKKPAESAKPLVKEIFPESHHEALVQNPLMGEPGPNENNEVIPPDRPGGRGLSGAEFKAKAAAVIPVDPELVEVIPPETPGTRGLTAKEVMAQAPLERAVDSELIPSPAQPGLRSKTSTEINAAKSRQVEVNPTSPGVPPQGPR